MNLFKFKKALSQVERLEFVLPGGRPVPAHFHVSELGRRQKNYVDCGGKYREESRLSLQLYVAQDVHHRLRPEKFLKIVEMAEQRLQLSDETVEVEYQAGETIGLYHLHYADGRFHLQPTQTACLANAACGLPLKPKIALRALQPKGKTQKNCC